MSKMDILTIFLIIVVFSVGSVFIYHETIVKEKLSNSISKNEIYVVDINLIKENMKNMVKNGEWTFDIFQQKMNALQKSLDNVNGVIFDRRAFYNKVGTDLTKTIIDNLEIKIESPEEKIKKKFNNMNIDPRIKQYILEGM